MDRLFEIASYSNHSFSAEIIDLFLDCQQDSATLISSSLVSKKWALSTRRHLFSNITISVGRGVGRFGDLFHSPHATITPFVESLSLIAAGAQCSTDGEQRFLIQLLSKLEVVPFHTFSLEFEEQDGYVLLACLNLRPPRKHHHMIFTTLPLAYVSIPVHLRSGLTSSCEDLSRLWNRLFCSQGPIPVRMAPGLTAVF